MIARVAHRRIAVDGVEVFYRESLPDKHDAPTLLLLHGFPSASHQFRRLIDALGARYRLVAPDYPGFGHTKAPDGFTYSFDRLADIVEGFADRVLPGRFAVYLFDFGAPVGFRLALRRPERIAGLVVQNGNAYTEGLSPAARDFIALTPDTPGAERTILDLFTLEATRAQYEGGTADPELIAPEGWLLDQFFLDQPGRKQAQLALAYDYHRNVAAYPDWQAWLREHRPPTLITWGVNDPFFTEAGAKAYLRDVPDSALHLFDTGHFALEDHLPRIAPLIADFLDDNL
ncbi:alpha/beta fold hydrolase [Actinokineospora sp. UTMC 2448]|uniref:alpha/beta fold hydrolase n=1 Tax=Actinokineospora sp. UTMC 2448 TaxID=2268449 RepID=UPI00216482E9|nr:alpha/beta hydrolase [Actinokineospora sp. UTMC 2448]UVS78636.1 4,5:9,10-diseco-3-hydroxy-5,9,17-trioxoandrosta-1(10),2-diene-4-oate hydrolase [Actinokineospora sp. UTMC 2448]